MDEDRLRALERRLRDLEDQVEIAQLVASYGPQVDAGDPTVAEWWTEDGVYDVDGYYMGDRAAIDRMVRGEQHQGFIGRGATHFLGPARVVVEGDHAVALCHSILVARHEGRFVLARSGANRWELLRTPQGWRVTRRTTRALDGSAEARALLGGDPPTAP